MPAMIRTARKPMISDVWVAFIRRRKMLLADVVVAQRRRQRRAGVDQLERLDFW